MWCLLKYTFGHGLYNFCEWGCSKQVEMTQIVAITNLNKQNTTCNILRFYDVKKKDQCKSG